MDKIRRTKGIARSVSGAPAMSVPLAGSANLALGSEVRLLSRSRLAWDQAKGARAPQAAHFARAEFLYAARMVGAPAVIADIRDTMLQAVLDLADVRISFAGSNTIYSWGGLLDFVNRDPCLQYFGATQGTTTLIEAGSDPAIPAAYNMPQGGGKGVWGTVVLSVVDIGYSSRFGGSFCAVLIPAEDSGIELWDQAENIAIDLHRWTLRLYLQPSALSFNCGYALSASSLQALMHCEIDVDQSEAYQASGLQPLDATVTEADIDSLIRRGEQQAVPRLVNLARFLLGWVHYVNIPAFNRTVERVDRIHVSGGMCHFDLSIKVPTIEVGLRIDYLLLSEGIFDSERELTAEPWLLLRTPPLVVLSRRNERYIGNARGTGWMPMGCISPSDFKTVHEITVFPDWTEHDPLSDDEGGAVGTIMTIEPDAAAIDQRIASAREGLIGDVLYALSDDPMLDWTTYSISVRFILRWR